MSLRPRKRAEEFEEYDNEYVDLDGNPIKRKPWAHRYSYDSYVQYKSKDYVKGNNVTEYSDRLYQRDYKKFNECCEKVWGNSGQLFYERKPEEINEFLNLYLGRPVKLTAVINCCNRSTGYPYWGFLFEKETK